MAGLKPGTAKPTKTIEIYKDGHISLADTELPMSDCGKCVSCCVGGQIVLAGTQDSDGCNQLLVWDPATHRTSHSLSLQDKSGSDVYGVTEVTGHIVVITTYHTYVIKTEHLPRVEAKHIRWVPEFYTPNYGCCVVTREDGQGVVLVGGQPKGYPTPEQYLYTASLSDLLHSTAWSPITNIRWTLGSCYFNSYDVVNIKC